MRKLTQTLFLVLLAMITSTAYADNVAKIGSTEYATLQAAIDAADEGATVEILKSFTLTTVTTSPSNKYNVNISKSLTIDGKGFTITSSNGKRAVILEGEGKNITIKDLTIKSNKADACLWIANNLTCNLNNTTIDGTNGKSYNQPLTIGSIDETGRVTLNITNNSVIKTNDEGTAHYAIILWHPADITVTSSTIKGWANVYFKADAAGSTVNISDSNLYSKGLTGSSNNFAMFVTESDNNTITLTDNNINIEAQSGTYEALVNVSSGKTGNTIKVLGDQTTFNTNDEVYGGIAYNWGSFENHGDDDVNALIFDSDTKEVFDDYLDTNTALEEDGNGNYIVSYTSDIHYYWAVGDGFEGTYCDFAQPFKKGWLDNNEYIALQKNITLTENIACQLTDGQAFNLILGDYTITKGDYSISLQPGVTVNTDKATDVFTSANADYYVTETTISGGKQYKTTGYVAKIGDTRYATLAAAIQAVGDNETITMIANEEGPGIRVAEGKNFTVDFNGHTYTLNAPAVGSTNTETLGFQLLKNSTITFKDGTINIAEENKTTTAAKPIMRVIQNYANLTLENMTIDGTNMYGMTAYVVSFNNGTSEIKGNTTITSDNIGADEPIIDCCQYSTYPSTNLKINTTGTIGGNIEISASNAANAANSKLEIINANVEGGITKDGNIDVPVAVSGGTFEAPIPEEYCADGFEPATLDPVTGVYTVASETNDVVLYDNATSIPVVDNKTVCLADRTLYAGMWNTICLPFGIENFEGTAFAGAEVREFTGASLDPDTKTLDLKFENTVTAIQPGVPYAIKPAVDVPNPTFEAVNITTTEASYIQGNDALAKFVGTFGKTSIPGGKEYLFITKGNSLVYITDGPFDYPGFRAYFQVTEETAAAAQTLHLSFDEGDTTAINGVETKAETTTEDWYTISGAKLQGKPAQKGIYIMNGKKVVVK